MKRIFIILIAVLVTASMFAQSPEKMSYQAVIRYDGKLLCNAKIGMQISIIKGTSTGLIIYT